MTTNTTASSGNDLDKLREEFEDAYYDEWLKSNVPDDYSLSNVFACLVESPDTYMVIETQQAWIGFQLARRASPQPVAVDEQLQRERENSEFTEWWQREQACPEHNLITENAAHAAWQERGRRAALTQHPSAAPSAQIADDHAGGDCVPMPNNADQAAGMVVLGTKWLEQNAPERLRATQPPTAPVLDERKDLIDAEFFRRLHAFADLPSVTAAQEFADFVEARTAQQAATCQPAQQVARVILRLIGEGTMDWNACPGIDPEDGFNSDQEELNCLVDLVNKALAAPTCQGGAQQAGEACTACNGSGWVVRDPDIGTDQECFVCDVTGQIAAPVSVAVADARDAAQGEQA